MNFLRLSYAIILNADSKYTYIPCICVHLAYQNYVLAGNLKLFVI